MAYIRSSRQFSARTISLVLVGLWALFFAARPVLAAIWVVFDPPSAAPGARIQVHAYGFPASPLTIFLVPKAIADSVTAPTDTRLIPIGNVVGDPQPGNHQGQATMRFVVPNLPPGDYVGLIHCDICAAYSSGHVIVYGGEFQVTVPLPQTGSGMGGAALLFLLCGLLLFVGGGVVRIRSHDP
jgi:hypothetical protein